MSLGNHPTVLGGGSDFLNSSGASLVGGPSSSTDLALVRWNGTTGKLVQNGIVTEASDSGTLTGPVYSATTTAVGSAFGNQPSNDSVSIASSNAADTTQTVTIIGTTTGGNTVVVETDTLTGTTVVVTTKVNWGKILAVKLSASCAGTVTISKTTALATITTITTGNLSAGVNLVSAGSQLAYNRTLSTVASGATTKQIGFQGTDTSDATIYDSVALTGATAVASNSTFRTVTEIYTGDVEGTRTATVTTNGSWTLTAGNLSLVATGTNQNITLTPSGTGSLIDSITTANAANFLQILNGSVSGMGIGVDASNNLQVQFYNGAVFVTFAKWGGSTGNLLLGGLTTDGTGVLQLPTATTSAGGIAFGTTVSLYQQAVNGIGLALDHIGGSNPTFVLRENGTAKAQFGTTVGTAFFGTLTAAPLLLQTNGATAASYDSSGNATLAKKIISYNNIATAGQGVPVIVAAANITAQSGAATITSYANAATDGDFNVSAQMSVTVSTALTTTITCTYTDAASVARTMVMPVQPLSGTFTAAGAITGAGASIWETPVMHIRAKASTTITLLTSAGTFTSVTYSASGTITQLA